MIPPESVYIAPSAICDSFPERDAALAAVISPSGSCRTRSFFSSSYFSRSISERYTVYLESTSSGIRRWSVDFMEMVMSEILPYICFSAPGSGL